MTTKTNLIDLVKANYDVVELIDRGATPPKLWEYDLYFNMNGVIKYKRISIFLKDPTNPDTCDAYFSGANPIPQVPVETFVSKISDKMSAILVANTNIKILTIETIDKINKRAILNGYVNISGTITEKKIYVYEDTEKKLQYEII